MSRHAFRSSFARSGGRKLSLGIAISILLVPGVAFAGGHGSSSETQSTGSTEQPGSTEQSATADEPGINPPEAAPYSEIENKWASTQKPLGDLASKIELGFAESYAYDYFNEDDSLTIGFKGAIPAEAAAIIKESGLALRVQENVGFNQSEYLAERDRVFEQVKHLAKDGVELFVAPLYGEKTGTIHIEIMGDKEGSVGIPIEGVVTQEPFGLEFTRGGDAYSLHGFDRAGGTWLADPDGFYRCTGGFVARDDSNNDLGIISAGHCDNTLRYVNTSSTNFEIYDLNYRKEVYGGGGDAQFHRSSKMMDAWFHATPTVGRPVLDVRNARANETGVCRYGRSSNSQACGKVVQKNAVATVDNGVTVGQLDVVNNTVTIPGDSGGPVFGGNTAMGVISGSNSQYMFMTQILSVEANLSIRVCLDVVCRYH